MVLFFLLAFDLPVPPQCVVDRCEKDVCTVETPEGVVDVPRKPNYKEGTPVECPLYLIEPT